MSLSILEAVLEVKVILVQLTLNALIDVTILTRHFVGCGPKKVFDF